MPAASQRGRHASRGRRRPAGPGRPGSASIGKSTASSRASASRSVDQAVEPFRLGEHGLAGPGRAVGADHAVGQRLGVPPDGGQRGAQLVRDRQQELALPALAGGQGRGEPVQGVRQVGRLLGRLDRHPHLRSPADSRRRRGRRRCGSAGPAGGRAARPRAAPASETGEQRQPQVPADRAPQAGGAGVEQHHAVAVVEAAGPPQGTACRRPRGCRRRCGRRPPGAPPWPAARPGRLRRRG